MKAFSGYEPKRSYVREQLPAGGYVVKIMDVKPVHNDWGDILLLSFDVEEGDKKGFFRDDYRGFNRQERTAAFQPAAPRSVPPERRRVALPALRSPPPKAQ